MRVELRFGRVVYAQGALTEGFFERGSKTKREGRRNVDTENGIVTGEMEK